MTTERELSVILGLCIALVLQAGIIGSLLFRMLIYERISNKILTLALNNTTEINNHEWRIATLEHKILYVEQTEVFDEYTRVS